MRRRSQLLALSIAAMLGPAIQAHAAVAVSTAPPPGLYRVDVDSDTSLAKGVVTKRSHVDGATGAVAGTIVAGAGARDETIKGRSQHTECIRADMGPMISLGLSQNCAGQATKPTLEGGIHTATCPVGNFKMTVRKLGKDVWEIVSETEQALGAGPANMSFMRPFLEHEAKFAAREEDRKKAAKSLADLARLDKEMAAKQAETLKRLSDAESRGRNGPGTADSRPPVSQLLAARTMNVRVRKVLTRISDRCDGTR
jgi:hypothetical protein